jgi:hypothetical protein
MCSALVRENVVSFWYCSDYESLEKSASAHCRTALMNYLVAASKNNKTTESWMDETKNDREDL